MRIHYEGPEAVVTSDYFIRRGPQPNTYVIRDLRDVCIAPDEASGLGAIGYSAAAALIAAFVIYEASSPWYALAFLGVSTVAIGCVAVRRAHRPRRHELRASYHGDRVALYASSDARVFNQVSRALLRAMENLPPPSRWSETMAA
jgi:Flp pilus assembly protein TadB